MYYNNLSCVIFRVFYMCEGLRYQQRKDLDTTIESKVKNATLFVCRRSTLSHPTDYIGQTTFDRPHPTDYFRQTTFDRPRPTDLIRQTTFDRLHSTDHIRRTSSDRLLPKWSTLDDLFNMSWAEMFGIIV